MKDSRFPFGPNVSTMYRFLDTVRAAASRQDVKDILKEHSELHPLSLFMVQKVLRSFNCHTSAFKASAEALKRMRLPLLTLYPRKGRIRLILIERVNRRYVTYYVYSEGVVKEPLNSFERSWNGVALSGELEECVTFLTSEKEKENRMIENYRQEHIELISNFLSDEECDELIRYVEEENLFQHSLVNNKGELETSTSRTSYTAFLTNRKSATLNSIYSRVDNFLREEGGIIEDLQVVRYAEGQEFKPHFDPKKTRDRKYTMLIYLNDCFKGGETYFPELGIKITPKKGSMLCFRNRDSYHKIMPLSLHAGLPVYSGTKYGCNVWVGSCCEKENTKLE